MSFSGKKQTGGGDFQNPTPGTVGSVCSRVIDMGTQDSQWGPKRRVLVSWEIDEKMSDGRPFLVSSSYTLSFHEKSALLAMLESWRGKAFGSDENIDLKSIVGKPALLNLVEVEGKNGGAFVNVKSVSPLPKGMPAIAPADGTTIFNLDEPDWDAFNDLSEKLQEKIAASPEYKQAMGHDPTTQGVVQSPPKKATSVPRGEPAEPMAADFDDEIPFLSYQKGWVA